MYINQKIVGSQRYINLTPTAFLNFVLLFSLYINKTNISKQQILLLYA